MYRGNLRHRAKQTQVPSIAADRGKRVLVALLEPEHDPLAVGSERASDHRHRRPAILLEIDPETDEVERVGHVGSADSRPTRVKGSSSSWIAGSARGP